MTRRHLSYGSLLTGLLILATIPLVDTHPAVVAFSFPVGALMFLVVVLAAKKWGAA